MPKLLATIKTVSINQNC